MKGKFTKKKLTRVNFCCFFHNALLNTVAAKPASSIYRRISLCRFSSIVLNMKTSLHFSMDQFIEEFQGSLSRFDDLAYFISASSIPLPTTTFSRACRQTGHPWVARGAVHVRIHDQASNCPVGPPEGAKRKAFLFVEGPGVQFVKSLFTDQSSLWRLREKHKIA